MKLEMNFSGFLLLYNFELFISDIFVFPLRFKNTSLKISVKKIVVVDTAPFHEQILLRVVSTLFFNSIPLFQIDFYEQLRSLINFEIIIIYVIVNKVVLWEKSATLTFYNHVQW